MKILVHEWVTGGGLAGSRVAALLGSPRAAPCAGRSRPISRLEGVEWS